MFNIQNGPNQILIDQIKSVIKNESPNITKRILRDAMKNDSLYRKEIVEIIKTELDVIPNNVAESSKSLYKKMKNKIVYNTDNRKD